MSRARYVVTNAQNLVPAHRKFLSCLRTFCKHRGAQLIAIANRYKNPTSIWSQRSQTEERWDHQLDDCLTHNRGTLGKNLVLYGDIKILPTTKRPIDGYEVFAGENSAIFGHPKIQLRTVPTASRIPRIFASTGAVTPPSYTDSRIGKHAEAHHVLGALCVEVEDDFYFLRQLNYSRERRSFIDLDEEFFPDAVRKAPPADAVVLGDSHVDWLEDDAREASVRLIERLRPRNVILHDVLDFGSRSHHAIDDPFERYRLFLNGRESVEAEVRRAVAYLDSFPEWTNRVVTVSNHHEHFDRWLNRHDARLDPLNTEVWFEFNLLRRRMLREHGEDVGAFELAYEKWGTGGVRFLREGERFRVGSIDYSFHGHRGVNGARGTVASYARLGSKTSIGHHHAAAILDGCYVGGTISELDHGYNTLPSGWVNCNILTYASGKRSLSFQVRFAEGDVRFCDSGH